MSTVACFSPRGEQNQLLSVSMSMEIKSESEYQAALKRLDVVFMADQSTPEGKEAEVLVDAIEAYEDIHHPIGPPAVPTMELLSAEPDNAESAGNNVPLIESIVSRASDILKLRFQDGSVGEITAFDEASVTVTDGVLTINGREIPPTTLWLNTKFL